jgi:hypothetical protein
MEVIYFKPRKADEDEGAGVEMLQQIMPMRGGLRGKGKSSVWVDLDAVVMIAETGLSGTTHEIVAVFSPDHIKRYRKLVPTADERLFMKQGQEDEDSGGGIIFEAEEQEEVNIDDI